MKEFTEDYRLKPNPYPPKIRKKKSNIDGFDIGVFILLMSLILLMFSVMGYGMYHHSKKEMKNLEIKKLELLVQLYNNEDKK